MKLEVKCMSNYITVSLKPLYLRRWWLKIRKIDVLEAVCYEGGLKGASYEYYTPLFFKPFEVIYNFIFGKSNIEE
jgi:hypothetical protein